jgi:hypothetical protein
MPEGISGGPISDTISLAYNFYHEGLQIVDYNPFIPGGIQESSQHPEELLLQSHLSGRSLRKKKPPAEPHAPVPVRQY